MPSAEIIAIGTELLLGAIQDTNTAYIAKSLNNVGIDVFRTVIIGDNQRRIAEEIRSSLTRADIVITTGGLGPTVDDPTREAVAEAFNKKTIYIPELWDEILNRFKEYGKEPSENNRRQSYIPAGAIPIHNPVGTAPSFFLKIDEKYIFSLPGVPAEMRTILQDEVIPRILKEFKLNKTIFSRTIHTAGIGESSIDELICDLERNTNPTVGLSAHPGQVDIRITAKAEDHEKAELLIQPIEGKIRELLKPHIFGTNGVTLLDTVANLAEKMGIKTIIRGDLWLNNRYLKHTGLGNIANLISLEKTSHPMYNEENNRLTITLSNTNLDKFEFSMKANIRNHEYLQNLKFGGHPSLFAQWIENQILYHVWRYLLQEKGE